MTTDPTQRRLANRLCPRARAGARRGGLALGVMLGLVFLVPAGAWADTAEPELAKYDKPVDQSIDKALAYLAASQLKDGSFPGDMPQNTAVASLCVMAFLAKGYTPASGPYAEVINKGIDFVLASQQPNGLLVAKNSSHGPMYCHTISSLMLSEVSGMVDPPRQKKLDDVLAKALRLLLAAQEVPRADKRQQGGWRYQPRSDDSDISCTGWALMALRSARNNGAPVPREAIEQAVFFVLNCRTSDGGFAYMPGHGPGLARTGTGLLCLELSGRHGEKVTAEAGQWILNRLPRKFGDSEGFFYYAMYYGSQGMFQLGGKAWTAWAANMYEMMLKFQQKDGSWPRGSGNEHTAGSCYATAMAVLAMSVSYRQLPIYQR